MDYPFRNLVFEGGGVKGIAYIGALEVLSEKGILPQIERVGGTSAGAINAVILALGYDLDELREILWNLNFNNFMDDSFGFFRDTDRLLDEFGWYKGDYFSDWIGNLVARKAGHKGATFGELKRAGGYKDLYLYGTNISTHFGEVFSAEHTPSMRIVDAARISMSIPLFFASIKNKRGDRYVDGGVLNNYPIKLFDREKYVGHALRDLHLERTDYYEQENASFLLHHPDSSPYMYNKETLGFRVDSAREIAVFRHGEEPVHNDIEDFFDYAKALLKTITDAQANQHLHSDDWQRTVYIDSLGVGTTDFDLSDEIKRELARSGCDHTTKYFDWYEDLTSDPAVNNPNVKREMRAEGGG